MIDSVTPVIIAKNAQDTISETLDSLTLFKEVVLYLNNSTDNTKSIVISYDNVKVIEGEFIGFGPTKNRAAEFASADWILSLDSDEVLNEELINEIIQQDFLDINNVFFLNRDNYFLNLKTSTNNFIARIYNRLYTQFNKNLVHEKIIITDKTNKIMLRKTFKHNNITDINQTLTKMIHYTDLGAKDKKTCFFSIVILKALFSFFRKYFLRLHILNGWRGFVISINQANRSFYKYLKRYINCQKIKDKLKENR